MFGGDRDPRALPSRTLPAPWTPAHVRARERLAREGKDVRDAHPEWLEVRSVIEDVDGWPVGLAVRRLPVVVPISGCMCGVTSEPRRPPLDGNGSHFQYDGEEGPGEPGDGVEV